MLSLPTDVVSEQPLCERELQCLAQHMRLQPGLHGENRRRQLWAAPRHWHGAATLHCLPHVWYPS